MQYWVLSFGVAAGLLILGLFVTPPKSVRGRQLQLGLVLGLAVYVGVGVLATSVMAVRGVCAYAAANKQREAEVNVVAKQLKRLTVARRQQQAAQDQVRCIRTLGEAYRDDQDAALTAIEIGIEDGAKSYSRCHQRQWDADLKQVAEASKSLGLAPMRLPARRR